ncbi:MAG: threonine synthase [Spirochaetes bacterium]|nr:threonine synthase [Spirochaetota bacterium]
MRILYHSTNNHQEKVSFKEAILNGLASNYGLYMMDRRAIPKLPLRAIQKMARMSYAEIAFKVLFPYVTGDIGEKAFHKILEDAYSERAIPVELQPVTGRTRILWLSKGPTYSFKDFAARFFSRVLNHFLEESGEERVVVVATSGDTGGAVAHALFGLSNVSNVVFFPEGSISQQQRRQMTTLGGNVHAFSVNGDFDVCQEIAKNILSDREFAAHCFEDPDRFTSANSISLGRLLPQAVYPFFAYSRLDADGEGFYASVPSGNFGDMMGSVIAKQMGLPIKKILCGVNENREFPDFLKTNEYEVQPSIWSPSTAMIVSHPSNIARLIEFYGGHIFDERDEAKRNVKRPGVIDKLPDMESMRNDIFSLSVSNEEHYDTIRAVYERYGIVLDPHGAVGWLALDRFLSGRHEEHAVVYETADPGKFPDDIEKAIGLRPPTPEGIVSQQDLSERIYRVESAPDVDKGGGKRMSADQYDEVKRLIGKIYTGT